MVGRADTLQDLLSEEAMEEKAEGSEMDDHDDAFSDQQVRSTLWLG